MGPAFLPATLLCIVTLAACGAPVAQQAPVATATTAALPAELVFYDWESDFPPELLVAFSGEYGIPVRYETYASQEEAVERIRGGAVYDLVVMGNEFVPLLAAEGLLAELDHERLPNFKHIAPDFRDLAYDPGNRHAVPYNWGTTGLVIGAEVTGVRRWSDLWAPQFAGKVAIWGIPRHIIAVALKSLGYSANSEDPAELEAAYERLRALKPSLRAIADDTSELVELFESGEAMIAVGYGGDVLALREQEVAVGYVLPEEGTLLWGDNFVIPAASPHKAAAELLIDYLLRPENSAAIANYNYYATPNVSARALIDPAIRDDPTIFPPNEDLRNAEIILPLSSAGQARYDALWTRLMGDEP